jgi:hypothetical protein
MKKPYLLRLDLQHFAEGDPVDPPAEPTPAPSPKTFTQEELDKIVADRLARERRKADELLAKEREEAERKKLEEQNEFKSLYEKTQAELEQIRKDAELTKLDAFTTKLLVDAGYIGEQLERVRKYVKGTNEDELKSSLEELKQDIPPKTRGVDPSTGNPAKPQPKPTDLADEGRSLYERLKAAGKIRR